MLSKRYESTEVDRRTWLHVHWGTLWSASSSKAWRVPTNTQRDEDQGTASNEENGKSPSYGRSRLVLNHSAVQRDMFF